MTPRIVELNTSVWLADHVYLIRDKTTNRYIPHRRSGGTYYEPEALSAKVHPRIFMTRRSAQSFLNVWLKGTWASEYHTDSQTGEVDVELTFDPVPSRIRENMEIIEANLHWSHAR